ncbi:hypothetical protein YC2023_122336 [Brassica napus]
MRVTNKPIRLYQAKTDQLSKRERERAQRERELKQTEKVTTKREIARRWVDRERVKPNRESYHKERDSSEMGRSRENSEMLELEDASWSSSELEMRQWTAATAADGCGNQTNSTLLITIASLRLQL